MRKKIKKKMRRPVKKKPAKSKAGEKDQSLTATLYDIKGKKIGQLELDKRVFDGDVNRYLLHELVLMHNARKRSGNAATKTRKEVRGGGKKPWRQKGTGRARTGSIRNPLWRGGGTIFGPHPRSYSYSVPAKAKDVGLKSGINSKLADDRMFVLDKIELKEAKTRFVQSILDALKLEKSSLVVIEKTDDTLTKASRNIPFMTLKTSADLNAVDVLRHENFVITESALKDLTKRLK